jgi:RNA polymerase sigma-70 factor (ECF subfamily)
VNTRPAVQEIEALIHEYQKLVFHTIYGLTNDWEESQDLTQDTFHQALRGLEAARTASGDDFRPKAWLLRIALNTVRMQRRRRSIFRFIPFSRMQEGTELENDNDIVSQQALPVQPIGYGSNDTSDPATMIAERDAVQRTLALLPAQSRECLLLSIVAGLTPAEIADALALKEPAVRQRLSRGRKQFQQLYLQESGEEMYDATNSQTHTKQRNRSRENRGSSAFPDTIQKLKLSTLP